MSDPVNHPSHYQSDAGIECIEAIEAMLGKQGFLDYCKGNAIKYIWRENNKGESESIRKAIWYLEKFLEVESDQANNI